MTVDARYTQLGSRIVSCSHKLQVNYSRNLADSRYSYCIGACLNVTNVDSANSEVTYTVLTPALSASHYINRGLSMAGTSLHITENGRIVMGLPGYRCRPGACGSIVIDNSSCIYTNEGTRQPLDSYAGYSVTSINMKNGDEFSHTDDTLRYFTGAPRSNWTGKVSVISARMFSNRNFCSFEKQTELYGQQYGSYFGATLCAVDVNNDGFDDLLVGAPFYNQITGDEGSVSLFLNLRNGTMTSRPTVMLTGSGKRDGRFGTAIATLGDINLDHYNDVIVGAPFEDEGSGAAYVYHGCETGLLDRYVQRLTPAVLHLPALRGFAYSFASRLDIDDNRYPDVAVSAFVSDAVLLLRTRPIHSVWAGIEFGRPAIDWAKANCPGLITEPLSAAAGDQAFCLQLTVVFNYSSPAQDPSQHDCRSTSSTADRCLLAGVRYDLEMDALIDDHDRRRGCLYQPGRSHDCQSLTSAITAFPDDIVDRHSIQASWVAVFPNAPKDVYTPVEFRLNFSAMDAGDVDTSTVDYLTLDRISPVLDPSRTSTAVNQIEFNRECGEDNVCEPELMVDWLSVSGVVVGSQSARAQVVAHLQVHNYGETAYSVTLNVTFPRPTLHFAIAAPEHAVVCRLATVATEQSNVTQRKVTVSSLDPTTEVATSATTHVGLVRCELTSALSNASWTSIKLVFDVADIGDVDVADLSLGGGMSVGLTLSATVGSYNDTRGPFSVVAPFIYNSSLHVSGSKDKEITLKEKTDVGEGDGSIMPMKTTEHLVQKFSVINNGPGLMPRVDVLVLLPHINDSFGLLAFQTVSMTQKDRLDAALIVHNASDVTDDYVTAADAGDHPNMRSSNVTERHLQRTRRINLVCDESMTSSRCRRFRFVVDTMKVGDRLDVTVNATILISVFLDDNKTSELTYISRVLVRPARLRLRLPINLTAEDLAKYDPLIATARGTLFRREASTGLPWWVLIVSIIVGLLLMAAVILILHKCGFFKRKQREQLIRKKRESARLVEPEDDDDVTGNDDNAGGDVIGEGRGLHVEEEQEEHSLYDNDAP